MRKAEQTLRTYCDTCGRKTTCCKFCHDKFCYFCNGFDAISSPVCRRCWQIGEPYRPLHSFQDAWKISWNRRHGL